MQNKPKFNYLSKLPLLALGMCMLPCKIQAQTSSDIADRWDRIAKSSRESASRDQQSFLRACEGRGGGTILGGITSLRHERMGEYAAQQAERARQGLPRAGSNRPNPLIEIQQKIAWVQQRLNGYALGLQRAQQDMQLAQQQNDRQAYDYAYRNAEMCNFYVQQGQSLLAQLQYQANMLSQR